MMDTSTVVGIVCTAGGFILAYLTFIRGKSKDDKSEGRQGGAILSELGYIKSGVDDIKTEQKEQRKTNIEFYSRLSAVESSTKSAHHRIDRLEGTQEAKE